MTGLLNAQVETAETSPTKPQKIKRSQAERVLEKFGGASRLARIFKEMGLDRNRATVYKWLYPRERGGTDGLIPTSAWGDVMNAARLEGILLTAEDMDPRVF